MHIFILFFSFLFRYDSRLFNQSSGMDSGFGADDDYATYSKPLFDKGDISNIYRPKRDDSEVYGDVDAQMAKLSDTSRFKADRGFKGAEERARPGGRDAPVVFESADSSSRRRYDDDDRGDSMRKKHRRDDDDE